MNSDATLPERQHGRRSAGKSRALFGAGGFLVGLVLQPLGASLVEDLYPGISTNVRSYFGDTPLVVQQDGWPWPGCGGAFVAAKPGGQSVESLLAANQSLEPNILYGSQVAVPFESAGVEFLLTAAKPGEALLITAIEPVVYEYEPVTPIWSSGIASGCGGVDQRLFSLSLQGGKGRMTDLGLVEGPGDGPALPYIPSEPLGENFTVAMDDVQQLNIAVDCLDGYYEFGFELTYIEGGKSRTLRVGPEDEPFKIIGGTPAESWHHNSVTGTVEKVSWPPSS